MRQDPLNIDTQYFKKGSFCFEKFNYGVVASLVVGIKAATPLAKVTFLLGGFVISALNTALLLGASKLIYLFTSIEQSLEQIRDHLKK
jgi:hypothetical protein